MRPAGTYSEKDRSSEFLRRPVLYFPQVSLHQLHLFRIHPLLRIFHVLLGRYSDARILLPFSDIGQRQRLERLPEIIGHDQILLSSVSPIFPHLTGSYSSRPPAAESSSHIEEEVHHISVLYDIVFSFGANKSLLLGD